jgi:hypothetical protein
MKGFNCIRAAQYSGLANKAHDYNGASRALAVKKGTSFEYSRLQISVATIFCMLEKIARQI